MVFSMDLWIISTSLRFPESGSPEAKDTPERLASGDSGLAKLCDRFVILTTQRSGSRFAEKLLNQDPSTTCVGEHFNFYEGQLGRTVAYLPHSTPDEIHRHGAQGWYQTVFGLLEQNMTNPRCAVGFRAFENVGEYESDGFMAPNLVKTLLEDHTVKKVILERKDTNAQWVSVQRACWFREWSDHHENDSHTDQRSMTMDHVRNGEFCGLNPIRNFTLYQQGKRGMYRRWYEYMDGTSQPYLSIKTEDLDKLKADPSRLLEFVLLRPRPKPKPQAPQAQAPTAKAQAPPPEAPELKPQTLTCESCSTMTRTISELKTMVGQRSHELFPEQPLPLPDTPDPRAGMSDIHFALLPGYQVLGKTSIKLSEMPWLYQCGVEAAVRTGSNVTFWYRGFPEGSVHDDITDGEVKIKHHTFVKGTQTGDWWFANSKNHTLDCPNAEVTVSDYIRQDILQRFGGVYMDLDLIILDDRLPHGPDGLPAQMANDVWQDQALVGNYLKYSPTSKFSQCMFDMWKSHWDAYVHHRAECAGGCPSSEARDLNKQWGFMGPTLVTHAYLSCKDHNVSVYPPAAFGNAPWPCNQNLVENDKFTLNDAYALHTCHELAYAVEDLGASLNQTSTMANLMQDRCPKTRKRLYSGKAAQDKKVAQNLMAYFRRYP